MTGKRSSRTTVNALPASEAPERLLANTISQDSQDSNSPSSSDIDLTPKRYQSIGLCFYCIRPLEAIQPGGTEARHVDDLVPYEQCAKALARKTMNESTYTMKFYIGRKLIAEQSWNGNEALLDEITHDAENAIEEAVQCNPPAKPIETKND